MIKNMLAVCLLVLPLMTRAATPAAPKSELTPREAKVIEQLEQSIKRLNTSYGATQDCLETEKSLQKSLAAKKAELTQEFNGKIPLSFSDYLWRRSQRIDKQHQACLQSYSQLSAAFTESESLLGSYEPKTLDVSRQRARVEALKVRFRVMLPTPKQGKAKPAASSEQE
ncbi:MAG: hypothetical protein HY923_07700 [Elusimicrobia bacterium]|nr:hypothetical protein [Elusimicrobiota bacterium]